MFSSLLALLLLGVVASAEITQLSDAVVKDLDGDLMSFSSFKGSFVVIGKFKCSLSDFISKLGSFLLFSQSPFLILNLF